ncbi:MAG: hypothetical protein ACRENE_26920 [Polyangiaceae bacterium]
MRHSGSFFLACACLAVYALPTGCGGSVEIVDGGSAVGSNGGGGGPGSSGVSSSSGGPGGTSSGLGTSSSGTSSGSGVTSPECAGQPLPAIAKICPDGSTGTPYYTWDGAQCVLTFDCPPAGTVNPGGPIQPSSSSSSGGTPTDAGALSCTSSAQCLTGLVCCVTLNGTTAGTECMTGPCAPLPILGISLQLCTTANECSAGQICGIPANAIAAQVFQSMSWKACTAPPDAGLIGDASVD